MPFEYDSTEELRLYWESRYRAQAGVEVASVDTPTQTQGVSGRAMHFTCGGLSLTPGAQPFATALDWTPTDKVSMTIGSAKGLTFWIKNTSGMQIAFRIGFDLRIVDDNGTITTQRWETDDGARYLLLDTVTGSERIGASKNGIAIPAGFEGWVRIGFEQFSMPAWGNGHVAVRSRKRSLLHRNRHERADLRGRLLYHGFARILLYGHRSYDSFPSDRKFLCGGDGGQLGGKRR